MLTTVAVATFAILSGTVVLGVIENWSKHRGHLYQSAQASCIRRVQWQTFFVLALTVPCLISCVLYLCLQANALQNFRLVRWRNSDTPTGSNGNSVTGVDVYLYQYCPLNTFNHSVSFCVSNPSRLNTNFGEWQFQGHLSTFARLAPVFIRAAAPAIILIAIVYQCLFFLRRNKSRDPNGKNSRCYHIVDVLPLVSLHILYPAMYVLTSSR